MNRITSRLAAHGGTRQVDAVLYADAAADAAERAVLRVWQKVLSLLSDTQSPALAERYALVVAAELAVEADKAIAGALTRLATWGHRTAAATAAENVPLEWLAALAVERQPRQLRESAALLEQDPDPSISGLVHLFLRNGKIDYADALGRLREPTAGGVSADQARGLFTKLLFPPPNASAVRDLVNRLQVGNQTWRQRMNGAARQFNPQQIASTIGAGYAAGKTQRQIAQDLLPAVNRIKASAARVARTYGLHVANVTNQQVSEQLGDLRVGDMIHATLDQNTRPLHRARNGTIYYLRPQAGQKPYSECPQPPLEADGSPAWNCRCFLTAVLRPPARFVANDPKWRPFVQAEKELIPDPAVYSQWFARADEKRRRLAVGTRRYSTAQEVLGRDPAYEELVEPETGELVAVDKLKKETPEVRALRVQRVRHEVAKREEAIRQVQTFGFTPPDFVPRLRAAARVKPVPTPKTSPAPATTSRQPPAGGRRSQPIRTPHELVAAIEQDQHASRVLAEMTQSHDRLRSARAAAASAAEALRQAQAKIDHLVLSLQRGEITENQWVRRNTKAQRLADAARLENENAGHALTILEGRERYAAHEALASPQPTKVVARPGSAAATAQRVADQAAEWIGRVLNANGVPGGRSEVSTEHVHGRASYQFGATISLSGGPGAAINLNPTASIGTAVHEIGHHLERTLPGALDAARAFLEKRAGGLPFISLKAKFGGYRDDEHGRKFASPAFTEQEAFYIGKDYGGSATEVLSMGLEKLYNDPVNFVAKDPEYFRFLLGILNGWLRVTA